MNERERERETRNSVVVTRKFDEECKLEREIRWKMYCHFSWRRSISPWNLARKISLLLLIYIHLQIFPIPITNINREIESRDSISIFHSIIPQISNFSTLGWRSKPEESGIKFFFSAPEDGDNNKQRIRREAKFLFPYPLPSSVQPRRARIYARKRITMGRGGKKKGKKGGRRGSEENNWTERSFEFLFHTCQSSKRTISVQPSISKRPRAGSYAPNDINPISSVPT